MNNLNSSLYYISSICWQESNEEEIINNDALQNSAYISIPKNIKGDDIFMFIDHTLYELTQVLPWYYNTEFIK